MTGARRNVLLPGTSTVARPDGPSTSRSPKTALTALMYSNNTRPVVRILPALVNSLQFGRQDLNRKGLCSLVANITRPPQMAGPLV